ncbi:MAG: hypothetical protein P4L71_09480 [Acetobacteraceae bacterium]|nr:hypothetical protein [Acetobacteraceae bacterium]
MVLRKVNPGRLKMRGGSGGTAKLSDTTKEVLAFKRAADAFVRKATSSEKAANQTMMRLGIQDSKGALTKHYK